MKWKKYRLEILADAEEIVAATLAECGVEGVEIVDRIPLTEEEKRQMFVDIAPETGENDGTAFLYFYLDPDDDTDAVLGRVRESLEELRAFCDIGSGAIDISETEDLDWINNWKQYFHQFTIDDIRIVPSWEEAAVSDGEELLLHIDPGTAFGTGMHETTQLCVRALHGRVKSGCEVLDVGTGSGILAIIACKLGAAHAMATDLDPCAVSAVEENCGRNGIPDGQIELILGNLIDDTGVQSRVGGGKYDIVLSNILADVLIPLAPAAAAALRPGAVWITSGILEGKEGGVIEAAQAEGLALVEKTQQGEWLCLVFAAPE